MIHIYFEADRIALHQIALGNGHYVTNEEHYPENKFIDTNYHIQSSLVKLKKIGPNTNLLVIKLFEIARNHPLRNLTKVMGVLSLADKYKPEAIEYGAESALESNKFTYTYIKNCVQNYRMPKEKTTLLPNRQLQFVCLQGGL
jgi:hypothetical protein